MKPITLGIGLALLAAISRRSPVVAPIPDRALHRRHREPPERGALPYAGGMAGTALTHRVIPRLSPVNDRRIMCIGKFFIKPFDIFVFNYDNKV